LAWGVITVSTWKTQAGAREDSRSLHGGILERIEPAALGDFGDQEFVQSPLLRRAIDAVAEVASRRGLLAVVEAKIDQADLAVRPAEALFLYLVVTILGGLIVFLLGNLFWGVGVLAALAILPWVVVGALAIRRTRAFVSQLPDMLQLLGATLRSGFSILQGLDTVAVQLPDPWARRCGTSWPRHASGRPLASALDEVAQRVKSEDFEWVVGGHRDSARSGR